VVTEEELGQWWHR